MANTERGSAKRIMVSTALIGFVLGGGVAAYHAMGEEQLPVTYASLFEDPVVDFGISGDRGVDGFIGGANLAPGDRVSGALRLFTNVAASGDVYDLDLDVHPTLAGATTVHELHRSLEVTRLSYGADDLLSGVDVGRDLARQMDQDPVFGNRDGRLSLYEMNAGANDLPPPRPDADGGSPFVMQLRFVPDASANSKDFRGQTLDVEFVFRLADSLDEDLN